MKNIILLTLSFFVVCGLQAQTKEVTLIFNHTVDGENLKLENSIYATDNGTYEIERLQYYLCQFSLLQTDGAAISFGDKHLLVNGSMDEYSLGTYEVNDVKGFQFSLGVDPAFNNEDPAQWPNDHPLAYQNPSMHWGWVSGYNFYVVEGYVDTDDNGDVDYLYNFHVIGNEYLRVITLEDIQTSILETDTEVRIFLNADYDDAFNGLPVNSVLHGGGPLIEQMADNIQQAPVFQGGEVVSSLTAPEVELVSFQTFPNPADDQLTVTYDFAQGEIVTCQIWNSLGQTVETWQQLAATGNLVVPTDNWASGTYWVVFLSEDGMIGREQISIQH
jgi:hypothetical protein